MLPLQDTPSGMSNHGYVIASVYILDICGQLADFVVRQDDPGPSTFLVW